MIGHRNEKEDEPVELHCESGKPLVALAFKITNDSHGDLSFLRIYQGQLKAGTRVLNVNRKKKENITRIYEMHANARRSKDLSTAGDIA